MRDTKRLMRKFNSCHYHKGFYIDGIENLRNMDFEAIMGYTPTEDCGVFSAYELLRGACYIFSRVLSEFFLYNEFTIKDQKGRLIHTYCKSQYKGMDVYIDVRGATTSMEEFVAGFVKSQGMIHGPMKSEERWEEKDKERYEFAIRVAKCNLAIYE